MTLNLFLSFIVKTTYIIENITLINLGMLCAQVDGAENIILFWECITKENKVNIKTLKVAIAGLVLCVSSMANAGLITTMELSTATTGLNINFDKVTWEWSSTVNTGSITESDLTDLTMVLFEGSNVVFEDTIINDNVVQNHVGFERSFSYVTWRFEFASMTLTDFDNYEPYSNLNGQSPYVTMNVYGSDEDFYATPSSDYNDEFNTTEFTQNTTAAVPEPATLAIFALAIMGIASRRFKKQ
jgi:hypothetical protein